MVRFIFICMAVVAVAIMTTTAQFMINGIEDAKEAVTARNDVPQETPIQMQAAIVAPEQDVSSPEALNAIDTAAGDDTFTGGFSNEAPKGLEDDAPATGPVALTPLGSATE